MTSGSTTSAVSTSSVATTAIASICPEGQSTCSVAGEVKVGDGQTVGVSGEVTAGALAIEGGVVVVAAGGGLAVRELSMTEGSGLEVAAAGGSGAAVRVAGNARFNGALRVGVMSGGQQKRAKVTVTESATTVLSVVVAEYGSVSSAFKNVTMEISDPCYRAAGEAVGVYGASSLSVSVEVLRTNAGGCAAAGGSGGLSDGAIAGIVVGSVVGAAVIFGVAVFVLRKREVRNLNESARSHLAREEESAMKPV